MKTKREKIDLVEQARQLRMQAEALERMAKMAKGTKELPKTGNVVVKPARGPYWCGDEGPTDELMTQVWRMLLDRPYTFQQILDATGARDNRVKGVIMRLQREGKRVVNIGDPNRALWFAPSDEVLKRILASKRATARE
jgi:hypothetical protein